MINAGPTAYFLLKITESTTIRTAGGLDFAAWRRERTRARMPQSLQVEPSILVRSTRYEKPHYSIMSYAN
jgi:hypothetical protein